MSGGRFFCLKKRTALKIKITINNNSLSMIMEIEQGKCEIFFVRVVRKKTFHSYKGEKEVVKSARIVFKQGFPAVRCNP